MTYHVIDTRTGFIVGGAHKTLRSASNSAERKNLAFGAHRYTYRSLAQSVFTWVRTQASVADCQAFADSEDPYTAMFLASPYAAAPHDSSLWDDLDSLFTAA